MFHFRGLGLFITTIYGLRTVSVLAGFRDEPGCLLRLLDNVMMVHEKCNELNADTDCSWL